MATGIEYDRIILYNDIVDGSGDGTWVRYAFENPPPETFQMTIYWSPNQTGTITGPVNSVDISGGGHTNFIGLSYGEVIQEYSNPFTGYYYPTGFIGAMSMGPRLSGVNLETELPYSIGFASETSIDYFPRHYPRKTTGPTGDGTRFGLFNGEALPLMITTESGTELLSNLNSSGGSFTNFHCMAFYEAKSSEYDDGIRIDIKKVDSNLYYIIHDLIIRKSGYDALVTGIQSPNLMYYSNLNSFPKYFMCRYTMSGERFAVHLKGLCYKYNYVKEEW